MRYTILRLLGHSDAAANNENNRVVRHGIIAQSGGGYVSTVFSTPRSPGCFYSCLGTNKFKGFTDSAGFTDGNATTPSGLRGNSTGYAQAADSSLPIADSEHDRHSTIAER